MGQGLCQHGGYLRITQVQIVSKKKARESIKIGLAGETVIRAETRGGVQAGTGGSSPRVVLLPALPGPGGAADIVFAFFAFQNVNGVPLKPVAERLPNLKSGQVPPTLESSKKRGQRPQRIRVVEVTRDTCRVDRRALLDGSCKTGCFVPLCSGCMVKKAKDDDGVVDCRQVGKNGALYVGNVHTRHACVPTTTSATSPLWRDNNMAIEGQER